LAYSEALLHFLRTQFHEATRSSIEEASGEYRTNEMNEAAVEENLLNSDRNWQWITILPDSPKQGTLPIKIHADIPNLMIKLNEAHVLRAILIN
jgi:hypothetical protein